MKLLFVQLPVQDPDWDDATANVPLAAGYLTAYAESQGLLQRPEWSILDKDITNCASDSAVIDALVASEPDVIAFSLYAWNLERSLYIAGKTKDRLPRTRLIAGGPEVVEGMPIMDRSPFNALVSGEGEIPFIEILRDIKQHRPLSKLYKADGLLDLATLPNPYLAGTLPIAKDAPVHIETMRGCPYHCAYCFYGKNYSTLRRYPDEQAISIIQKASQVGSSELYIMDPSFQFGADLEQRLVNFADANTAAIPMHTEMRLDTITEKLGSLMKSAGIASIEAGLQSINPKALEAVNRGMDKDGFVRGAEILQKQHIIIKTGLILGLPFDGYEQVVETFDFLGMHGLGQEAELYPLSFLPGTDARERADEWRMSRMELPPYWVTSNDWISGDDMIDAIASFEESFDVEWAAPPSPHFTAEKRGYRAFIDTRKLENIDWMRLNPARLANSVTLLADADDPESLSRLVRAARDLRRDNPYTLYQIILTSDTRIPSERLVERIQDAFIYPDHYYELSHFFSPDPQEGYQTRMFFATKNFALAYRAIEEAQDLETMVIISGKAGYNAERLSELLPYVIFDRERIPFDRLYELLTLYADFPHMLIEAPEDLF
ncbi:MAG TPA: B12-binding domain-containing radical SAM protein [Rectinemataceae bacterium]|nr:B12-binding domain-containing radical SAM protein [Rectinemataceae bacterium]